MTAAALLRRWNASSGGVPMREHQIESAGRFWDTSSNSRVYCGMRHSCLQHIFQIDNSFQKNRSIPKREDYSELTSRRK